LKRAVCLALLAVVAARTWLAARTDLMGDEAFYWLCSRRLDLGYSDHPPMTALLARLGTALGGYTPLGLRWPFGLCGLLLPVVVWLLARRLRGDRVAWWAAGLCLVMPLVQLTPTLATPDAPLMLLAAATLLFTDRALEGRRLPDWLAAGACAGAGMATHYRFTLVTASILAWLLLTRAGRRQARSPGVWCAAALTLAGCVPAIMFNARVEFAPILYQFAGRHGEALGPRGWAVQVAEQALIVTPLLFAALAGALVDAWRRARAGDQRACLLAYVASSSVLVYFVGSAVSDQSHDHLHWAQAGYLPLLVYAPEVLQRWASRGRWGRSAALLAPGLAGVLLVVAMLDLATGSVGLVPRRSFLGWRELARQVDLQREAAAGRSPILVADTYIAAAQLDFHSRGSLEVHALDHPVNRRHGRALQFALWGLDEAGLARRAGEDALLVLDREETRRRDAAAWEERVRSLFEHVERVQHVDAGERTFEILWATNVRGRTEPGAPP
jgi:hypothetical protein